VEEAILTSEIDNADLEGYGIDWKMERGKRIITLLRVNIYMCCDSKFIYFCFKTGNGMINSVSASTRH
jgi:hypothetical protein